jgi:hypothetical protein
MLNDKIINLSDVDIQHVTVKQLIDFLNKLEVELPAASEALRQRYNGISIDIKKIGPNGLCGAVNAAKKFDETIKQAISKYIRNPDGITFGE